MDFPARTSRPSLFAHVSGRLTALRRMVLRRRRLIAMVLIAAFLVFHYHGLRLTLLFPCLKVRFQGLVFLFGHSA